MACRTLRTRCSSATSTFSAKPCLLDFEETLLYSRISGSLPHRLTESGLSALGPFCDTQHLTRPWP